MMTTIRQGFVAALMLGFIGLPGLAVAGFQYDEDTFNKDAADDGPPEYLMPKKAQPAAPPKNSLPFCDGNVQKYMYYDFRTSESWCITKTEAFRRYIPSNAYKGVCCKLKKGIPSTDPTVAPKEPTDAAESPSTTQP